MVSKNNESGLYCIIFAIISEKVWPIKVLVDKKEEKKIRRERFNGTTLFLNRSCFSSLIFFYTYVTYLAIFSFFFIFFYF